MQIQEHISLSELTTFRVGGLARFFADCTTSVEVQEAVAFAHAQNIPFAVLGEGSNVLASDDGYDGLIIRISIQGVAYIEEEVDVLVTAGAGVSWDMFVIETTERALWGHENLAGIPGTVGATPVQNVGAYGAEIAHTFESAKVFDTETGTTSVYDTKACGFGYRDSVFKHNRSLIILSVTYRLRVHGQPQVGYSDLARLHQEGADLGTPERIAHAVRLVRAKKFPDLAVCGTAGSFFKNPLLTKEQFETLTHKYGMIPSYPAGEFVKIPLAFILDHVLGLRGYQEGNVHLFGNQPLVLVAESGASAREVDAFANSIAKRVHDATGISIEREVRSFP